MATARLVLGASMGRLRHGLESASGNGLENGPGAARRWRWQGRPCHGLGSFLGRSRGLLRRAVAVAVAMAVHGRGGGRLDDFGGYRWRWFNVRTSARSWAVYGASSAVPWCRAVTIGECMADPIGSALTFAN